MKGTTTKAPASLVSAPAGPQAAKALLETALSLQNLLVGVATGGGHTGPYAELRQVLLDSYVAAKLPQFVRTCRDLNQFWHLIKHKAPSYAERRTIIYDAFAGVLGALEAQPGVSPSDPDALARLSPEAVQSAWQKALARKDNDPEGAITAARALLEAACKHILDDLGQQYDDHADLPKLYALVAKAMNLAPSQHEEDTFKRILGGCTSVVEGLGTLRNKLGDAHGAGRRRVAPQPRHAQLAVNLAGSMTDFLVSTWEARKAGGAGRGATNE
ncbi:MAG: abortive infection family protein [Deltaproteobacteria bacterium]|nr:abortive infection family protein [Deltaproteobacteria bacterium]